MKRSAGAIGFGAGILLGLALPGTAHADPAGPTDFRTTIVSVTPSLDGVSMSVEGGDSFLRIVAEPGRTVEVPGYDGEPYLRIDSDGMVERNRRSFATYYNDDRYGEIDTPAFVDNAAAPEWEVVGAGGVWAWHDHRAHWMGTEPPIGLDPGESLPDQIVPIVVDGTAVSIVVRTTLQPPPSRWPLIGVAVIAGLLTLGAIWVGPAGSAAWMGSLALACVLVGLGQWWSLPPETGRLITWWLLPVLAVGVVIASIAAFGRSWLVLPGASALAAMQVALWAVARSASMSRPVLPTVLPDWLDRGVTVVALVGSVLIGVASLGRLVGPTRRPRSPD